MNEVLFKGSDNAAERIVLVAALAAGLLIVAIQAAIHARKLNYLLGPAEWKFKERGASTITAAGAILGTVLASGAMPKDLGQEQLASFAGLSLLFGVAVVSPLVYSAITSRKIVDRKPVQLGYVAGCLIACFLTVWAVVGRLGTLLLLLLPEIARSGSLSAAAAGAFQVVIVVALVLSLFYAFRTIGWAIADNAQENTEAGKKSMMMPDRGGELEPRSWSLL